jgi:phosphate uptake regulator
MDIRKVQKVSAGTYIISLPKKWAVRHGIKAGTVLFIDENSSGSLTLQPKANLIEEKIPTIGNEAILDELLIAHYIMGAKELVVASATPDIRARTLASLHELPGLAVAHESKTSITIKYMLDENTVNFYALLDRMCVLLKYGAELVLSGDREALLQNEQEINRNYNLSERVLTRASHDAVYLEQIGLPLARIIPTLQLLMKRLEHVGDAMKDIERVTPPVSKWLHALVDMICSMVRVFSAQKLEHAAFPTKREIEDLRKGHEVPQLLFLVRTVQDVKEELILLQTAFGMLKKA